MTIIEAQVKDQELKVTTEPLVASGGINETTIHFSFCENWTNFVKTAVFADAGKENWYNVVLDANKAVVPAQVTATKGRFWFGVVGIKDQTRYTTKIIQYDVAEGVTLAEEDVEPPQTLIDQLMAALGNVSAEAHAIGNELLIRPSGAPVKDDTVAYIKDVPAASLPAAKLNKIGGMTRKCTNLLPYPYAETTKTNNGVTYTDNGDGTITVNGTAANQSNFFFATNEKFSLPAGTYTFSVDYIIPSNVTVWLYKTSESRAITNLTAGEQKKTFTLAKEESFNVYIFVGAGAIFSNAVLKPMLNAGTTALPYEPYFEGLRSASTTEVESVGANLATAQAVYEGANAYAEMVVDGRNCVVFNSGATKKNYPIKFKENTRYTVSFYKKSENRDGATANNMSFTFWYSDGTQSSSYADKNDTSWTKTTFTSDEGKTVVAVGVGVMEYRAYVYLDIDTFMFNEGSTALPYTPYTKNTLAIPEAIQAIEGYGQSNPDNAEEYNYIDLKNERFAAHGHIEGSVWRAYDSVQYTPIKLDGFIGVEGGGTLTFKNEYGYAVPSEVEYYINAASGVIVDGSPALKVGDTIITEAQLAALLTMITQEVNDDQ